jgi:hypothetical protein
MSIQAVQAAMAAPDTCTGNARNALFILAFYANDKWTAWPHTDKIAERMGVTPRAAQRAVAKLVSLGLISRKWVCFEGRKIRAFYLGGILSLGTQTELFEGDDTVTPKRQKTANGVTENGKRGDATVTHKDSKDKERHPHIKPPTVGGDDSRADAEMLLKIWNEETEGTALPTATKVTPKRIKQVAQTLKDLDNDPTAFRAAVQALSRSKFHTGGGGRGWKAGFDYITKNGNALAFAETTATDQSGGEHDPYQAAMQRSNERDRARGGEAS